MKVLVATDKPFAKVAVDGIRKEIEAAGYDAMIYSNMLWEAYELDLEKLSAYPVWYADYELKPQTPYHFEVWQYTNQGSVDGINGRTDINIQLIEKPSK